MSGDVHVRCCECPGVRFPWPTRLVFGYQHKRDAEQFLRGLKERLGRFGLELYPEETRLVEFGGFAAADRKARGQEKPATFDFLGFTHYCKVSSKG